MELSYKDMERRLRDWGSGPGEEYDFVGLFNLFRACLANLNKHAMDSDWEAVADLLEADEVNFLRRTIERFEKSS